MKEIVLEAPVRTPELSQYIRMRLSYRTKVKGGGWYLWHGEVGVWFWCFYHLQCHIRADQVENAARLLKIDPLINFLS